MNWIEFEHGDRAICFLAVLLVVLFFTYQIFAQRRKLGSFVGKALQPALVTRVSLRSRILQIACLTLSGILFVIAFMQPQIVQKEHVIASRDKANIFIALDVSKSMLATDVAPDRLERAKSEIRDMLPSFSTHNVGLIAFAGRPTVLSPLTMDHGFFRLVLDSASPKSVTLGGTNIGEVIRKGTRLLSAHEGPKAMILITDGEDHDSYPIEAAEEARRAGVVIITVGFGSETGSTIDVLDRKTGAKTRIKDAKGADVISRLDGETLRQIAAKTGGVYVPAETGVLDLESIMIRHILPLVSESTQENVREVRIDIFQWFVGLGLIFFFGFLISDGRLFRRTKKEKNA
ncbi:MAG: VWA domain-containing protein [Proteobacteria bacterium]|nr:VWA domain-containing protein [Pseudomonadota bacterium]MBQ4359893.1 VWA domain-containing protein [Pseudomonadota bacterium]